jgi:hypothetical protein
VHVLEMVSDFVFAAELPFADEAGVWCGLAVHAIYVAEHVAFALESYVAGAHLAF